MSEKQSQRLNADPMSPQDEITYRDAKVPEGSIACALAESLSGGNLHFETLDEHYKGYVVVRGDHHKATSIALTIWAILFLLQIGGLEKAEIMGVEPHGDVLKMVGLFAVCYSFMRAMVPWQKAGLYEAYFQYLYLYRAGSAAMRQELALRYPLAFDATMFLREMIGTPEGWKWRHTLLRLRLIHITSFVLLIMGMIALFWLLGAIAIDVVRIPGRVGLFWTWLFLIASALCLLYGFAIASQRQRVLTYGIPVDTEGDVSTPPAPEI